MAERAKNQTTISSERRVTIPAAPLREAGFKPGDILKVKPRESAVLS